VTYAPILPKVQKAASSVGIPLHNIFIIQGQAAGTRSIQDLILMSEESIPEAPYQLPRGTTNKQLCGNLNFSSGTTGLPKAVSTYFALIGFRTLLTRHRS
jgi:acyl-coenzyme A synthetase/AMP-(fatty) acid ligase